MMLLLDVGNSRVKWAWWTGAVLDGVGAASHLDLGLAHSIRQARPPGATEGRIAEIRLASTAGADRNAEIRQIVGDAFGVTPRLARSVAAVPGLKNAYRDPAQLGADRWLAMRAAMALSSDPCCVVDAGTATTVDLVGSGGVHHGGFIIPGITMMQAALRRGTGDLDSRAGTSPPRSPPRDFAGRDTGAAMSLGALRATASLIERAARELQIEGGAVRLVLTGGEGPAILAALSASGSATLDVQHRPWLVLEGLALASPDELRDISSVP